MYRFLKGWSKYLNSFGAFQMILNHRCPALKMMVALGFGNIARGAHRNYKAAAHMNTRFICTSQSWFGGGGDLTPLLPDEEVGKVFHDGLKKVCDNHNPDYYPKYKKWCDEYFFLPHRNEPRGIGGIFYDNLDSANWHADFAFTQDVGRGFCDTYVGIVKSRMDKSWTTRIVINSLCVEGAMLI